jgi:hypothetical protein
VAVPTGAAVFLEVLVDTLLSAHRFFIASDKRFRPAGVRPPLRPLEAAVFMGTAIFLLPFLDSLSSNRIARLIRSLSLSNSEMILSRSNICLLWA